MSNTVTFQYESMASVYNSLLNQKQELERLLTRLTNEVETIRSIMNAIVEVAYQNVNTQVEIFGNLLDQMQQYMAAEDLDIASSIGNV